MINEEVDAHASDENAMPISLTCSCGKRLSAPDALAGTKARCVACGAVLQIPRLAPPPPDDDLWELAEAEQLESREEPPDVPQDEPPAPAASRPLLRQRPDEDLWNVVEAEQRDGDVSMPDAPEPDAQGTSTFQPAAVKARPRARGKKRKRRKGPERIRYAYAFLYPLTPSGLLSMIADGVLLTFFGVFAWFIPVPILPLLLQVFTLFAVTHLGIFLTEITYFTANGIQQRARLPEFNMQSVEVGYLWWLATLASLLPAGLVTWIAVAARMEPNLLFWLMLAPFLLLAAVYQPIAILGFAVQESLRGLHPATVVRAIERLPGPLLSVTIGAGLTVVSFGVVAYLLRDTLLYVSVLAFLWLTIYGSAVLMRIVGALYYNHRKRFQDWQ
jgi:hypothetical protein